jgi:hypothetical protein
MGDIVRVKQLGTAGYEFRDQAYVRIASEERRHASTQYPLKFCLLSQRDAEGMWQTEHNYPEIANGAFSAPPENLDPISDETVLAVEARVALNGGDLVITPEPVSLA